MIILITGSNRGLGFEMVKTGLEHGHTIIASWLGFPEKSDDLQALKVLYSDKLEIVQMDVSNEENVKAVAQVLGEIYESIDCVVNNAGVLFESKFTKQDAIVDLDISMFKKTIEINTVGVAIVCKYFMPLVYASKEPCIINISSEAGHLTVGGYQYLAYSVSKHAVNMYSQQIRNYLASTPNKSHIRLFMLHPGRMNTVMGAENAQIEPYESANGLYDIIEKRIDPKLEVPFINYKGEQMPY